MTNTDTPRPLFPIALAFISGIVVFDYIFPSIKRGEGCVIPIFIIIALFFIITLIIKSLRHSVISDILLIGLCFLTGAVRLLVANQIPANHITNFPHDDVPIYLEGVVTDEPFYYQPKNEFLSGGKSELSGSFTIQSEAISWSGQSDIVSGLVRVSFYGLDKREQLPQVKYGNRLRMLGKIYSPRNPTNPGEFDYGQFLKRQGIYKTLRIKSPNNITLLATGQGNWFWGGLQRFRNFLADKTDEYFNEEQASLLKALILGERPAVPDTIETDFMRTGTIHILSVSGLHLAMVAGFLFLLLGGLGVTGRNRAILLIISAGLYAVLTGLSTPVTRSLVMIAVYFGSEIFIRKSNPLNSIALAGLIITAYNPNEVFSGGFQLSFLSVISIVSFTTPILALMRYKTIGTDIPAFIPLTLPERLGIILKKYLVNAVAVSCAATLGVFPLVLMYFHLITPVSILANIVLSPLVFLIMLFGFINMPLAGLGIYSWFVPLVAFLTRAMIWVVDLFSRIPFAYFYLPDIPQAFVWVFYGLFLLWLVRGRLYSLFSQSVITRMASTASDEVASGKGTSHLSSPLRGEGRVRGNLIWGGALIIMLGWFLIWAFSVGMPRQQDGLTLTMLDVRQGASFVLRTPNGKTILYDCGTFGSRDVGEQVVSPFLWNKGITRIDTLILSHAHLDHINGVQSILEKFPIKEVMVSPHFSRTYWGKLAMQLFGHYGIRVSAISQGDVVNLDLDVIAEVLGPPGEKISENENDLSLVIKIHYGNKTVLLCGDIQAEGLKALFDSNNDLSADILQIPHHGFAIKPDKTGRSYLEELITRANPSEIVINTDGDEIDEGILDICRARDIIIHSSDQRESRQRGDKDGAVTINLR
ncbi:MAG: DNA internalization-related competence protein ComEC/Rec2 [Planctomycetes bacterium]|nr:DNA internalization-related competence protein ComEC/Rec2 [Planctomycetota bacterium]